MEHLENKIKLVFMTKVTLTQRINYTKFNLGYATVGDVVKIIREGNILMNDYKYGQYTLKQAVEYIRSLNTHAEQQQWKERLLPAVAYNGVFSEVEESHIMQYSNVTAMDFDDIEGYNEMQHLWRRLVITPCVYSVFVTPSGGRLKALVLHAIPIRTITETCMNSYWPNSIFQTLTQVVEIWQGGTTLATTRTYG